MSSDDDDFLHAFDLQQRGDLAAAEAIYRRLIAANPRHADALHMLGLVAHQVGQTPAAMQLLERSFAVRANPLVLSNLAEMQRLIGRTDDAVRSASRALQLQPDFFPAHHNLASALEKQGDFDQAIEHYRAGIALQPNAAYTHSGLASALHGRGDFDAALAAYRHAVALAPTHPETQARLALLEMLLGDFASGLPRYEWRLADSRFSSLRGDLPRPRWTGQELAGQTILLRCEQGAGDAMQFVRYVPLLRARGANVTVLCRPDVLRLFQQSMPGIRFVASPADVGEFDFHSPLMSLPHALGTTLDTIPRPGPYLHADPAKTDAMRPLRDPAMLNVGLAWAGAAVHIHDRRRSMTFDTLAPLLPTPRVRFFSLQKGPPAEQCRAAGESGRITDVTDQLTDFADTAALIANLDLVISADTSVIHLAAAMGKRTWTMLSFVPDWRWQLSRTDSPWYPTMRLFRQPARGDWGSVVEEVKRMMNAE